MLERSTSHQIGDDFYSLANGLRYLRSILPLEVEAPNFASGVIRQRSIDLGSALRGEPAPEMMRISMMHGRIDVPVSGYRVTNVIALATVTQVSGVAAAPIIT